MSEFFVMYPYRKHGLGKEAAFALFDRFPGTWQLKYHPKTSPPYILEQGGGRIYPWRVSIGPRQFTVSLRRRFRPVKFFISLRGKG